MNTFNNDNVNQHTPALNALSKKWGMLECELYAFARCLEGFMPFDTECVGKVVDHPVWKNNQVEQNIESAIDVIMFEMMEYDRYSGFQPIGFTRDELALSFLDWVNKLTCTDLKQLPEALLYINACRELSSSSPVAYHGVTDMLPEPASEKVKKSTTPQPLNFYRATGEELLSYFNTRMSDILPNHDELDNWEKYKHDAHVKKHVLKFATLLKDVPIQEGLKSNAFINQYVKHNNSKRTLINRAINYGLLLAIQDKYIETVKAISVPEVVADEVVEQAVKINDPTVGAYIEMLGNVAKQLTTNTSIKGIVGQMVNNQLHNATCEEVFDKYRDWIPKQEDMSLVIVSLIRQGFKLHLPVSSIQKDNHNKLLQAIDQVIWHDPQETIPEEIVLVIDSWLNVKGGNINSFDDFSQMVIGISVLELIRERVERVFPPRLAIVCFEKALQPVVDVQTYSETINEETQMKQSIKTLSEAKAFLLGTIGDATTNLTPEQIAAKKVEFSAAVSTLPYWEPETVESNFATVEAIMVNYKGDDKLLFAAYLLGEVEMAILVHGCDNNAVNQEKPKSTFADTVFNAVVDITTFPKLAFGAVVAAIPGLN